MIIVKETMFQLYTQVPSKNGLVPTLFESEASHRESSKPFCVDPGQNTNCTNIAVAPTVLLVKQ